MLILTGALLCIGLASFLLLLALSAPRIVQVTPADGTAQAGVQDTISITFDQPWLSVPTGAVTLDPPVAFTTQWQGRTLLLIPQERLRYNTAYRLNVSPTITNLFGRPLTPAAVAFRTVDHVGVRSFTPAADTGNPGDQSPGYRPRITVEFDTPIVSAEQVAAVAANPDQASTLPQPLTLTGDTGMHPQGVAGVGRWLSPTRFGFYPEADLHMATTYIVTVGPDLTPDGRAALEQPLQWSFTTGASLLVGTRPYDGATEVPVDQAVEVQLMADVDMSAASANFLLVDTASGASVAGTTFVSDDGFVFRPAAPLQRGAHYEARLEPGIPTQHGVPINEKAQVWDFKVMGDLAVAQVEPPASGADILTTTQRISVRFNHPVVAVTTLAAAANLPQPLTITPALPGSGRWLDTSTYVFEPDQPLPPATNFQVRVAAGLHDQTGGTLHDEYTWSFMTIMPRVIDTQPVAEARYASPQQPMRIVFNQPMAASSLPGAIRLQQQGSDTPVAGTVSLNPTGDIATFTPQSPLERGTVYVLMVSPAAQAVAGNTPLAVEHRSDFRVAPLPELVTSVPASDAADAETGSMVQLTFNTPMDWASVEQNLTIAPAPADTYTYTDELTFHIGFAMQPETDYRLTIGAAARDAFGTPLGTAETLTFRTRALAPWLAFAGVYELGAYNAYTPTEVLVQHVNVPSVDYRLYQIDAPEAITLLNTYEAWDEFSRGMNPGESAPPFRAGQLTLAGERNATRLSRLSLGQLAAGIYALEMRGPADTLARQIMVVSPYALTIKHSAGQVFVWAVDLASGQPVADLALTASLLTYTDSGATRSTSQQIGYTDNEGILQSELIDDDGNRQLFVWSESGQPFTFASSRWDDGINPWSFDLPADTRPSPAVATIYTERPIYRPGQTVYMRGALRLVQGEDYALPAAGQHVSLTIQDPQYNTVAELSLPINQFGTFTTSLTLEPDVPLGNFQLQGQATVAGSSAPVYFYGSFLVAEYRKPAFEMTVTPDQPDVTQGDTLNVQVAATYFSGGAVAQSPIRWRLLARPFTFASATLPGYSFNALDDAYEWYRWQDGPDAFGGSELVSEGSATTDAQGRFTLSLPAELGTDNRSRQLTLDIEVTDIDGQIIAAQGAVTVHAGAFYIGLNPEGYVARAGEPQRIALATRDPQDQPVGNQTLQIEIYQREWYSVREQRDDGRFYWTSHYTDTLVATQSARTDAQGRGSLAFSPPAAGSYRITASGQDRAGHTIKASAFTWAYGGSTFWGIDDSSRIDLIADKTSYQPGETATILVPAPYTGMQALMTLERGSIIEHRLFTIQDTTDVLRIPITAAYAPNVYVSVVLFKPAGADLAVPDMRMGLINLPISTEQQQLNIAITPDNNQVGPRDQVTYNIRATDYSGQGVQAELSLALVDKAILTLADDPNPTFQQAFYEKRPLHVFTANSLIALVDRVTLRLQPGAKGGGGGGGDVADILTRRNVPDIAYWHPAVVTDHNGNAQVTITLPDNLTTWRLTARGLTADTLVGQATNDVVATRPLLVRPALPRFLTVGDRPVFQAVIQNTTANPVAATVTLAANGVNLESDATQTVAVAANGQAVVRWQAAVPAPTSGTSADTTTLHFSVAGNGLQDAVEQVLPIQRFTTPEVVASAGQVRDTPIVETLDFATVQTHTGEIKLELVPSLAAGVDRGLDYLTTYPYGCTEQTVSRFLPNAVTYRLFKQLGLDDPQLKSDLEQNLAIGLQRLATLQHLDGGWGWWTDDESHPYLTAYVVQGLLEARKAGSGIDEQMLKRGLDYLKGALDGTALRVRPDSWQTNTRAYVLYVLAQAGQADRGRTIALFDEHQQLDIYGRAYLLMTLKTLTGEDERMRVLVGELMSTAVLHPTSAHWQEGTTDYWTMSTDTRSTALALQALVQADPENFLIPNAVRHLMGLREHGHWSTTQETATTLMALAEYIAQSGELAADYSYQASLDNRTVSAGVVNRANLHAPIEVIIALADLKQDGASQLAIQRQASYGQTGQGRLYYTLHARYYQDANEVQPLDQGITVQRDYVQVDPTTLLPTGELTTQATMGAVVQVRLTLTVPETMHYLVVEDMLPAGLEALDTSLKTVTQAASDPALQQSSDTPADDRWHFGHTEIRDNRVALFATHLPRGTYHYTYLARASTAGTFQTLPTVAYQMYMPEVFGRSAGTQFTVQPGQ